MQGHILNYLSALRAGGLRRQIRQLTPMQRKVISIVLAIVIVLSAGLVAIVPAVTRASETDVLANGSFEHGFVNIPGCGVVGAQWSCFTNGGVANYGFDDDQWEPVVSDGKHSQLIEINTKGFTAADTDRYAGISQTVRVTKYGKYTFNMRGMIRTTNSEGDPYRYVVQVGWAEGPNADWRHVKHWTDTEWYTYFPRTEPGYMSGFRTTLMPETDVITVFVRVWKKWGVANEEIDVNLDAISLVGSSPQMMSSKEDARAMMGGTPSQPMTQPDMPKQEPMWPSGLEKAEVCGGPDLVYNGNFEHGFNETGYGEVGRGWGPFTNGGAANYGFYDEQWEAVISMADMSMWRMSDDEMKMSWHDKEMEAKGHGQLIEINTKDMFPADSDRYAGIYQRIGGLTPGATYKLELRGLLRGTGDEADPYRFAAEWGIASGSDTDWRNVYHWEEMDLGPIYPRTEPGSLATYTARFKAPSSQAVLFIRGWNKWAVSGVELDFNLDDISLYGCGASGGTGGTMPGEPMPPMPGNPGSGAQCTYVVKAGDTLGGIAAKYDVSIAELSKVNGIDNPNIIYVGQKLTVFGCSGDKTSPSAAQPMMRPVEPVTRPQPLAEPAPMIEPGDRPVPSIRAMPMPPVAGVEPRRAEESADTVLSSSASYTVQAGESLGQIAVDNGIDAYTLAMANNIDNLDVVYVGQVLRIP